MNQLKLKRNNKHLPLTYFFSQKRPKEFDLPSEIPLGNNEIHYKIKQRFNKPISKML